ncbi:META domain-containing protein [Salinibius halmophilus]|uniref:META domain-containing protein n=1 Tax=Salinibius halmophilus TaxID=1853216 RepID=UPI000E668C6A|nr:META domain-containing protein [Salinibius halmophilus]
MKRIALLALAASLSACQSTEAVRISADDIQGIEWQLVELNGGSLVAQQTPVLLLQEGRMGGVTTCNNYFGQAQVTDSDISLEVMGVTEKFCQSEMETEDEILSAFAKVTAWQADQTSLTLLSEQGVELMRWQKQLPKQ